MALSIHPVIEARRARRAISDRPIPSEVVDALIQAAHLAPSCGNNQPWRFIVVDEPEALSEVKAALSGGNYWAKPAPVIVAVASQRNLDCLIPDGREYYLLGCGLALAHLLLEATDRGLIAHPIAGFKQAAVREALRVPKEFTVIALVILGAPTEDLSGLSEKHRVEEQAPRNRRPLGEVAVRNRFSFDIKPPEQG